MPEYASEVVGGKKIMAFPVVNRFYVDQAVEPLVATFGQIIFKQRVRQFTVVNDGGLADGDVVVSLNGTDTNFTVKPGDSCSSDPLLDGWYYEVYVKYSALPAPNYRVMSSEK